MSAKLSVIFYIILCLEIGIALTVAPWWPHGMWGMGDWGNNYFLLYAARTTGIQGLQSVVASGWVRGAVSGVGLLNLGIAFWEIFNFNKTVAALQRQTDIPSKTDHAARTAKADYLSADERDDHESNDR
jgi:hypothetical protein